MAEDANSQDDEGNLVVNKVSNCQFTVKLHSRATQNRYC